MSGNKAPASLTAMETQTKKIQNDIDDLLIKKDILIRSGASSNDSNILELDNQVLNLENQLESLDKKMQELKLNPQSSMEAQNLKAKIDLAENSIEKSKEEANELAESIKKTSKIKFKGFGINFGAGIGNSFKDLGNKIDKFKNKMTRLVSIAMVFSILRKGLTSLSNGFISLLKSNVTFNNSLNQIKANLLTAFTPVYNYVLPAINTLMNALSKITGAIATFVSSLFGQTADQAKNNAKQLYSQAKATEAVSDAQERLGSFDKLEVNGDDNSSSGGGGSSGNVNFDIPTEVDSGLLDFLNSLKSIISTIDFSSLNSSFTTFVNAIKGFGVGVYQCWLDFFNNLLLPLAKWTIEDALPRFLTSTATALNSVNWDVFREALNGLWQALLPFAINVGEGLLWFYEKVLLPLGVWTMNELLPAFFDILSGALNIVNKAIQDLTPIWEWFWENVLAPIIEWTGGVIVSVLQGIGDALNWISQNEVAMTILESLAIAIGLVAGAIAIYNGVMAICNVVTGIFSGIMTVLTSPITLVVLAIAALIAIIKLCIDNWDAISNAAKACWNFIVNVWNGAKKWFMDTVVQPILDIFGPAFNTLIDGAKKAWEGIKSVFSSVASFFGNIFGKAWEVVKGVFSVGGKVFDGIKDGIINAFKAVVNALITGINKVVSMPFNGLNTILQKIHDISFLGISPFSWLTWRAPVPQLPHLATGAVIPPNAKFTAVLGDQTHGKNLEAPEGLIRKIVREESGDKEVILNATFIMQCETEEIGRASLRGIKLLENIDGQEYLLN